MVTSQNEKRGGLSSLEEFVSSSTLWVLIVHQLKTYPDATLNAIAAQVITCSRVLNSSSSSRLTAPHRRARWQEARMQLGTRRQFSERSSSYEQSFGVKQSGTARLFVCNVEERR